MLNKVKFSQHLVDIVIEVTAQTYSKTVRRICSMCKRMKRFVLFLSMILIFSSIPFSSITAAKAQNSGPSTPLPIALVAPSPQVSVFNDHNKGTSGFIDVKWNAITGASGYKVGIYNGTSYQYFDVGNSTSWSTKNQGIWPSPSEIAAGRYQLHTDHMGVDLSVDPGPVYKNAGGAYGTHSNYLIKVIADSQDATPGVSKEISATILPETSYLGTENFWPIVNVPNGLVNSLNGNLIYNESDVSFEGRGPSVSLNRTYNSLSNIDGPFGNGWTFNQNQSLTESDGNVFLTDEDGTVNEFIYDGKNNYLPPLGEFAVLTKDSTTNTFSLKEINQTV